MTESKQPYRIKDRPPTIYRVVKSKDNPYVMIDRRPIENPTLSFKAKGILTYLLSRPDGWEVSVADLIKRGTDGEAGVRAGLKELKNAGHMKYTTSRKAGRITGWLIEVYEVPDSDFQQVEIQDVENRTQVLSTLSNKNDRYSATARKLETLQGANKGTDADLITVWIEKHTDEWIDKAIQVAKDKGARSSKYVDSILQGWEANGYPKPRSQQVTERKSAQPVQVEVKYQSVSYIDGVAVLHD
jgi:DnaD/phage-associated family protein